MTLVILLFWEGGRCGRGRGGSRKVGQVEVSMYNRGHGGRTNDIYRGAAKEITGRAS